MRRDFWQVTNRNHSHQLVTSNLKADQFARQRSFSNTSDCLCTACGEQNNYHDSRIDCEWNCSIFTIQILGLKLEAASPWWPVRSAKLGERLATGTQNRLIWLRAPKLDDLFGGHWNNISNLKLRDCSVSGWPCRPESACCSARFIRILRLGALRFLLRPGRTPSGWKQSAHFHTAHTKTSLFTL